MSKVLDTVKEITVFNGQDTTNGVQQKSRMLTEKILRNSYSVLSIPVAILKLAARNHLLKILHLNYGNGIPAVIARTDYDSNSQTKTINSTDHQTLKSEAGSKDASSSISIPNLEENGEKIRFLEQQIKAQAEARKKDASPSISLPNLEENGEKFRFLEQQIKAQAEAGSKDASSSISIPNLEENGEKIRFLEQQIKAQAKAGSKDASSSIPIPNLEENGNFLKFGIRFSNTTVIHVRLLLLLLNLKVKLKAAFLRKALYV